MVGKKSCPRAAEFTNWISAPRCLEQLEENLQESILMHQLTWPETSTEGLNPKLGVLLMELGGAGWGRMYTAIHGAKKASF